MEKVEVESGNAKLKRSLVIRFAYHTRHDKTLYLLKSKFLGKLLMRVRVSGRMVTAAVQGST